MEGSGFIAKTGFVIFILAVILMILLIFSPTLEQLGLLMSDAAIWVIGVLGLLSTILGLITFKTPQGKIAAIGGILLLLAVLFVTPLSITISQ